MWKDEIYLVKLALITGGLFASLLAAGTYFISRESYKEFDTRNSIFSEKELGWDFKNFRDFNDCGIREPLSCGQLRSLNIEKILFLGNSVVEGSNIEIRRTFTKVFQDNLPGRYYVVNGGFDGYEIYREFQKFKRDLEKLNFSSVFWFITRSDIRSRSYVETIIKETRAAQGHFEDTANAEDRLEFIDYYVLNLKSGVFLKNIKQLFLSRTEKWFDGWKDHVYCDGILNKPDQTEFGDMISEILSFNSYLRQRNINLVVVFLPDRTFSSFYKWKDAAMFQEVSVKLDGSGIPWISLTDDFPDKYGYRYYSDFVHLNEEGHKFVGSQLASRYMHPEVK